MARRNHPPRKNRQPESRALSTRSMLDNQRIYSEATNLRIIAESSPSDVADYAQKWQALEYGLADAFGHASDPASLEESYSQLVNDTLSINDAEENVSNAKIEVDQTKYPIGTGMAYIVINNPHPESFLSEMLTRFNNSNPIVDQVQKAQFLGDLDRLAQAAYGDRYAEYQQQLEDRNLPSFDATDELKIQHEQDLAADILGDDHRIGLAIDRASKNIASKAQMAWAKTQNILSAPSNNLRGIAADVSQSVHDARVHRFNRAQAKYDAKQEKIDSSDAPLLIRNAQQGLLDRRQRRLEKKRTSSEARLRRRQDSLEKHTETMEKRIEDADISRERRNKEYDARVRSLSEQKSIAIARRAMRRELLGLSDTEQRARLQAFEKLSPTELSLLARAAGGEHAAKRLEQVAQRQYDESASSIIDHDQNIEASEASIREYRQTADSLRRKIQRYREAILPRMEQATKDAEEPLKDSDPTSRDYDALRSHYHHATSLWRESFKKLESAESALAKIESQISSVNNQLAASKQAKQEAEILTLRREQELRIRQAASAKKAGAFHRTLESTKVNQS